MSLIINIYYTGENGNARKFANEMISSGIVDRIRNEEGNLKYEYFFPTDENETVLLIDKWKDEEALEIHHKSLMMKEIAQLREKYNLKMRVEKYKEWEE
ncbi:MAG: antibiotic biosynthesis monooxygenase [Bacilli bacterium]|nr:antibiotic biosynthesis monooxygenase [Bacilli bacterium]